MDYNLKELLHRPSILYVMNARLIETRPILLLKTLREIYLLQFQICVRKSAPLMLMTAFNEINGEYCSENNWLIRDVLRNEWGFNGMLMSDFEGTYTEVDSVRAGLNLEMPGSLRFRAGLPLVQWMDVRRKQYPPRAP